MEGGSMTAGWVMPLSDTPKVHVFRAEGVERLKSRHAR